ncbi:hypothetical protein [Glaciecola sp. SC05]|uniref:hypothetical protein n=1 Tax=Glaciecola sp. SC05 TaxID=1987355 RepID=UPI003528028A
MNSSLPPDDRDSLTTLYQARKKRHHAPVSHKQSILDKAAANLQRPIMATIAQALTAHLQRSVVYASLAIAVVIVGVQSMQNEIPAIGNEPITISYRSIQIHSLESEQLAVTDNAKNLFQYNEERHKALVEQAQQIEQQQVLRVIKQDSELQLVNCNDELIEISKQALAMLVASDFPLINPSNKRFNEGQLLAITFDQNGYILHIDDTAQTKQCT